MEMKELDKKQLVLLTLLITFVVSIATGIITVSLMNQIPKSVPQTINNIIQRTIEKVVTTEVPIIKETIISVPEKSNLALYKKDAVVSIYRINEINSDEIIVDDTIEPNIISSDTDIIDKSEDEIIITPKVIENEELGQGVIISDIGLVLVDSSILAKDKKFKIILDDSDFDAIILKKFKNGFTILQIKEKEVKIEQENTEDIEDINTL